MDPQELIVTIAILSPLQFIFGWLNSINYSSWKRKSKIDLLYVDIFVT